MTATPTGLDVSTGSVADTTATAEASQISQITFPTGFTTMPPPVDWRRFYHLR